MSSQIDPAKYHPRWQRSTVDANMGLREEAHYFAKNRVYSPHAIKTMRGFIGISQRQLAYFVGVTTPAASRWETEGAHGRPIPIGAASILSLLVLESCGEPCTLLHYLYQPPLYSDPIPQKTKKKSIKKETESVAKLKKNKKEPPSGQEKKNRKPRKNKEKEAS